MQSLVVIQLLHCFLHYMFLLCQCGKQGNDDAVDGDNDDTDDHGHNQDDHNDDDHQDYNENKPANPLP